MYLTNNFNLLIHTAVDWMSVRYGWSESFMSKTRFRLYFILPPTIIAFGFAIPPLFLGMYNYGGTYQCFIASETIEFCILS